MPVTERHVPCTRPDPATQPLSLSLLGTKQIPDTDHTCTVDRATTSLTILRAWWLTLLHDAFAALVTGSIAKPNQGRLLDTDLQSLSDRGRQVYDLGLLMYLGRCLFC
jgi:hypothetical protein